MEKRYHDGQAETIHQTLEKQAVASVGRQSLRETIISRLEHSQSKAYELERLKRLVELLDKHPDILEIMGLVRDLGLF